MFGEPRAVLASHERSSSFETAPGTIDAAHFAGAGPAPAEADDYTAYVLGALAHAATTLEIGGGLLLPYDGLPESVFARVLPHFGVTINAGEQQALRAVTQRDAKRPERVFSETLPAASPERDRRAQRWLEAPYGELSRRAATAR